MTRLHHLQGLTTDTECRILGRLAADVPADQVVVEVGVFRGKSLCHLAAGAMAGNEAHVYGVDPYDLDGQDAYDQHPRKQRKFTRAGNMLRAVEAVRRAGLQGRVTIIRGFSVEVAQHQWHEPRRVGLLYVDGDHRADAAYADYVAWEPHLAPDATICWDDYWPRHPGVVEAVDRLVAEGKLTPPDVRAGRLAITRRQP